MSANNDLNNSFLNAFSQGRETPQGLVTEAPDLSVPTGVPFVQPPNTVSPNILQAAGMSGLAELGKALGTGGVFLRNASAQAQAIAKKKQDMENNRQYSSGLVDATNRAAKTRDIFSDMTQNGMMSANKNPFYNLGLQTGLYQNLASQYRRDLVEARNASPEADPLDLQDQVKQKYASLLSGGRPEVVSKFFIQPSTEADKDDEKAYDTEASKRVKQKVSDNLSGATYNTLSSDLQLLKNGVITPEKLQQNAKASFENILATYTATGVPYKDAVKDTIDTVKTLAGQQDGLSKQMMVLDFLKQVKTPDGRDLLSNNEYAVKYAQARHELHNQYWQERQLQANTENEETQVRTSKRIAQLYDDFNNDKVGKASDYTQVGEDGPIDYDKVMANYNLIQRQSVTAPEAANNSNSVEMASDANHMSPEEFEGKWGHAARNNPELAGGFVSGMSTANSRQKQREEEVKPRNWNTGIVSEYTKSLVPTINLQTSRWAGYNGVGGLETARKVIPSKLQQKYKAEIVRSVDSWIEKQAQSGKQVSDGQIRNYIDSIWYNGMEDRANSDIAKLRNLDGKFDDIISPSKPSGSNQSAYKSVVHPQVQVQTAKPKQQQVYSPQLHETQYSWAVKPAEFETEAKLYNQRQGKIYQYLVQNLKQHNKLYLLDEIYKRKSAINILQSMKSAGYPTFLGAPTGNNKPTENKSTGGKK